jgi:DNA-binding LacI/PurR family transcriptional regulator
MAIDLTSTVPLHCQISDAILEMIRSGEYSCDDLLFTEVGLCKQYGVSLAPVRQAVNGLVAQGILERRRAKGVFLGRSAGRRPYNPRITFVTPDISHSFYGAMVRGGEHCARTHGYDIVIANTDFSREKEAAILADIGRTEPHIVALCTNGGYECRAALVKLIESGFVAVMIDRHYPDVCADVVENDNVKIGREATEYLLSLGHRRIAHLTVDDLDALNVHDRRVGYTEAMEQAGLATEVEVIKYCDERWDVDGERRTCDWLNRVAGNVPTACFVVNDTLCVSVIRAMQRCGLSVPENVSLVGCADLDFARMLSEPLTTIDQDSYGMGVRGVQMGIDRLEGRAPSEPVRQVHPHRLVERISARSVGGGTSPVPPPPGRGRYRYPGALPKLH